MTVHEPLEIEPIMKDGGRLDESEHSDRRYDRSFYIIGSISIACVCTLLYFYLRPTGATDENPLEACPHPSNDDDEDRSNSLVEEGIYIPNGGYESPYSLPDIQHCIAADYSKTTAKMIFELPLAALLSDHRGGKKFEASDVVIVNDYAYVVCDNSWAITKLKLPLRPFSEDNMQIGNPTRVEGEESDYEAIFHHDGVFYAIRESVKLKIPSSKKKSYHAVIDELDLNDDNYAVLNQCPCEFEFEGTR